MSQQYRDSGVDIEQGDKSSQSAASYARKTFVARAGKIGEPVNLPNGFAGVMDFRTHYMVQCCDTVGTKIDLALKNDFLEDLGKDLLAMVVDDAVCLGAEAVSITNTFETEKIIPEQINQMMKGLSRICLEQGVVIAGGEIAEVGDKISGTSWGADAMGIVEKDKIIDGTKIQKGDAVITLQEKGFRCNGFSLIRHILKEAGLTKSDLARRCLRGSEVYQAGLLHLLGGFEEERKIALHGVAHITGGGISGNISRILPKGMGVDLSALFHPSDEMKELAERSGISSKEFYEVWNGGNGMLLIVAPEEKDRALALLSETTLTAQECGIITDTGKISLQSFLGERLEW